MTKVDTEISLKLNSKMNKENKSSLTNTKSPRISTVLQDNVAKLAKGLVNEIFILPHEL